MVEILAPGAVARERRRSNELAASHDTNGEEPETGQGAMATEGARVEPGHSGR
jgi:hypothetical protein